MRSELLMVSVLMMGVGGGCEAKGAATGTPETAAAAVAAEPLRAAANGAAIAAAKTASAVPAAAPVRPTAGAGAGKIPAVGVASAAGTQGPLTTLKLGVAGMSCVSCEMKIRAAVEKLPGVSGCVASVATTSATVSFDPGQVSRAQIEAAIQGAGYSMAPTAEKLAN